MTKDEEALALKCVDELLPRGRTYSPEVWLDFASRFLAAIREQQTPAAATAAPFVQNEVGYIKAFIAMPYNTPLFLTPPAKEQDGMVLVPREPTEEMIEAGTPHTEGDYSLPYSLYKAMLTAWEKQA